MRIKEFTEKIAEGIRARLVGVDVTPMETIRNNGVVLHGLTFRREGENVSPMLYLDNCFHLFEQEKVSEQDVVEKVMETYEELPKPNVPSKLDEWLSSPELMDKISIRLLNMEANRELIEKHKLVYHELEKTGLVCLFYVRVIDDGDEIGYIALTEYLLEWYLPTVMNGEALYNEVTQRVTEEDLRFEPVSRMVDRISEDNMWSMPPIPEEANFLYVLTNRNTSFGAAAILTEAGRRVLAEHFQVPQLTVIPSSVHEMLVFPTDENENVFLIKEMVQDVNRTQLAREEFLSDDVYHYNLSTGEMKIATIEDCEVDEE